MKTLGGRHGGLPDPTTTAGVSFRRYAGEEDIPAIVELKRTVNKAFDVPVILSVGQERIELGNPTNVDPRQDYVHAIAGDRMVATSSIEWADTTDGQRHYYSRGWVHPEWQRRGIGTAMLTRNEARLTEIAASHQLSRPPVLMTWLEDADTGGLALFEKRGYESVRVYRHMVRPDMEEIGVAALPEDIEVRPVTPELLPQVWAGIIEAFRDHFGAHDESAAAYRRWSEDPGIDLDLWAVAFDGDEVVAGVLGYIEPEENELFGYLRGWTDPVFTRRAWRRRGLAYALLGRCLVRLREHGMTSAQLDVDTQNPSDASTLYRRHGFEVQRGESEWHRPLSVSA